MLKRFACLIISLLVVGCNGAADDTGGEKFPTQVPGRDTNPGRVFSNADPKVTAGLPSEFTTATLAGAGARELKPSRGDAAPQGESEDLTVGGRDWPVFRGNLQATGWLPKVTLGPLRERWRFALEKGQFESSPVIAGGLVFAASSGGELVAVGLESGTLVWRARAEGAFTASPSVFGGRVFIGDDTGLFYCWHARKGELLWKFSAEGPIDSPASFWEGNVLFGSQDGNLYCLEATSGQLRWKYTSDDQIRCFPAICEGKAFLAGCDGHLHVVDLAKGEMDLRVPLEGPTGNAAAVLGEMAYVGTEHGRFVAIDWKAAKVVWVFQELSGPISIRTSAAVSPEIVVFGARDRKVRALQPDTGKLVWAFSARGKVDSSPVVLKDRVLFGCDDGRLYVLDAGSGTLVAEYELGAPVVSAPAVVPNAVVVGTLQGELICLGWADD
jgi:outer membrane protein assembly factor BamB